MWGGFPSALGLACDWRRLWLGDFELKLSKYALEYLSSQWELFVVDVVLELDVRDEKLFLGKVDRLDRKFWPLIFDLGVSYGLILSTDWRDFLCIGDSRVELTSGLLRTYTGMLDLEFLRFLSGEVGETTCFSSTLVLMSLLLKCFAQDWSFLDSLSLNL